MSKKWPKLCILGLWMSFPLIAQDECPPSSEDMNQMSRLAQDMDITAKWAHCKRFGIKDRGILQTPSKIAPEVLSFYRQKKLLLEDPIGDFALTRAPSKEFNKAFRQILKLKPKPEDKEMVLAAAACAEVLFELTPEAPPVMGEGQLYLNSQKFIEDQELIEKIIKKHFPEDGNKIRELFKMGKLEIDGDERAFESDELSQELINVILEEEGKGIPAQKGEKHRWSREFKDERSKLKDILKSVPSKMMATLSGGKSSQLLVTEKEQDLEKFIQEQNNLSLTPKELFRKSYQLNQGNVYLSLLTVENVLSKHWLHPKRNDLKQTNKLKPIGKVFGSHGDVFGHWYHLFGIMTSGYSDGKFIAQVAGEVEAQGSRVISGFKNERQENMINRIGAKVGGDLRGFIHAREKNQPYKLKDSEPKPQDDWEKLIVKKIKKELKK